MSSDYVLYDRQELHECVSVLFDNNEEVFEFEQDAAPPPLKGRLKNHVTFWESINANRFIVEVIKSGYRIPLINTPVSRYFPNNRSAFDHSQFVESAILELVKNSAV